MEIRLATQDTLGIVEVNFSGGNAPDTACDALSTYLADDAVKAAVIRLRDSADRATPTDTNAVAACLLNACIPLAAVIEETAALSLRSMADACLMQFSAPADGISAAMSEAAMQLRILTDKRPSHVIRAVMTSLRNAETLDEEIALLEETKLFCTLSRHNREATEEGKR